MNSKKEVKEIRKFAEDNGLEVISCGYYHPWCDENVNASPKEFLEMFNNASFVVTDTFHGTVFSLINEKPFGVILRGNDFKVKDLLEKCCLTSQIVEHPTRIRTVLANEIDYISFSNWLSAERKKSKDFIMEQIGIVNN